MKALVIDSASPVLSVAAKNDDVSAEITVNLARDQSAALLPAIDFVFNRCNLIPARLDYTALCKGPGAFTGLRLAYSALKAIELSCAVPVYAVPTLKAYAWQFKDFEGALVPVIKAKRNQFFAAIYKNQSELLSPQDTAPQNILSSLTGENQALIVGTEAHALEFSQELESCLQKSQDPSKPKILHSPIKQPATVALFALAEQMILRGECPVSEYEGPDYLRKSEAELSLTHEN